MTLVLTKVQEHTVYGLYSWRSLAVLVWKEQPTVSAVGASTAALEELLQRSVRKPVFCSVAAPRVALPDGPGREALQKAIKRTEARLCAAVNVILATGFAAAAVRGVLTGFNVVVRPPYPVTFVGSIAEGASGIVRAWPADDAPAPDVAELAEALHAITPR